MRTSLIIFIAALVTSEVAAQPSESDFFKDTISQVEKSVDLVQDYGVSASDDIDDSDLLQSAIDELTKLPKGGKIFLPAGKYHLIDIELKDNVHLVIDKDATIVPTKPAGFIFKLGLERKGPDALVEINNVSIRGNGGRYTVDLTSAAVNEKLAFAYCKNVDNFMIADLQVLDNYTKLSSVTVNLAEHDGKYFLARHGVVKNGDVKDAHCGYGLIQVQLGHHLLFKDLSGQGGVTLRLESGAVTNSPPEMNIDDVHGYNLSNRDGSSAFIMGAHVKVHGQVHIDGATSYGSAFAGCIGRGFATTEQAAEGHVAGHFGAGSTVRNVHAIYGEKAQLKSKNRKFVPEKLLVKISKKQGPDQVSFVAPSVAAMKYHDPDILLENVTVEGFKYQSNLIIVDRKKVASDKAYQRLQSIINNLKLPK